MTNYKDESVFLGGVKIASSADALSGSLTYSYVGSATANRELDLTTPTVEKLAANLKALVDDLSAKKILTK